MFKRPAFLLALAVCLAVPAVVWACPLCKDGLIDREQTGRVLLSAKAYALSIGVLLSMPALLIGGITTHIVRGQRRKGRIDTPETSR